jgi:hypothetical protein
MIPSLNEIETETKRAVRGAGLPWGTAEEAGKALRWQARRGLDALPAMARLLAAYDAQAVGLRIAEGDGALASAEARLPLCPFAFGATLHDRAHLLASGLLAASPAVAWPLLALPFAAKAARHAGLALKLSVGAYELHVPVKGEVAGNAEALCDCEVATVACLAAAATPIAGPTTGPVALRAVDADAWAVLSAFAFRTYVPASEVSRRRGAGAGEIDND